MNAKFFVNPAAQAHSEQNIQNLLCLEEFSPPLDLRSGGYRSSGIPQKFSPGAANSNFVGLSMFWNYMKIVRRDRAAALRGEYSDYLYGRSGLELTRLFEMYGGHFDIQGVSHLQAWLTQPDKKPVVFTANHMSTLETLTLCGYITPYMPTTFVVKSPLAQGYFEPLICSRPYIALTRRNPLADLKVVLQEGCDILQGNLQSKLGESPQAPRSIIIFSQGTRTEGQFSRSRFNSIAVRLAAKAGVSVVPIALSTSFWSRSPYKSIQYIPQLHPERQIHFAFGPPIAVTGSSKETQRQVLDFISDNMRQWGTPVRD